MSSRLRRKSSVLPRYLCPINAQCDQLALYIYTAYNIYTGDSRINSRVPLGYHGAFGRLVGSADVLELPGAPTAEHRDARLLRLLLLLLLMAGLLRCSFAGRRDYSGRFDEGLVRYGLFRVTTVKLVDDERRATTHR